MAEPRVLIGGKFAFDFVIQSSSPKKLLQGLKSVLCCKTSPKKTTKGFCRLDILSSSSTKKSFPKVTLGPWRYYFPSPGAVFFRAFWDRPMKDVIQVHNAPLHSILPATKFLVEAEIPKARQLKDPDVFFPKRERNARFTSTQILLSGNYTLTQLNCKRIEWIQLGKNWLGYITPQARYRFWLITQSSKLSGPFHR